MECAWDGALRGAFGISNPAGVFPATGLKIHNLLSQIIMRCEMNVEFFWLRYRDVLQSIN